MCIVIFFKILSSVVYKNLKTTKTCYNILALLRTYIPGLCGGVCGLLGVGHVVDAAGQRHGRAPGSRHLGRQSWHRFWIWKYLFGFKNMFNNASFKLSYLNYHVMWKFYGDTHLKTDSEKTDCWNSCANMTTRFPRNSLHSSLPIHDPTQRRTR